MPALEGGSALPVTTGGAGQTEARAAVPVYVVSGGPVIGQRARRVVVVTSGPVEGGAAIPVYDMGAGAAADGDAALPVFVVSGSLGGGVVPAFTPTSITGLQSWYKADSLLLNDGDLVASWADSGGAMGLAATAAGGARPTYRTNIKNGRPVVRFNGTANGMATVAFGVDLAQPTTWFVVAKNNAVDTIQRHIVDGLSTKRQAIGRRNVPGVRWFLWAGTFLDGAADDTNWNLFTVTVNGASSSHQLNAAAATTGAAGAQVQSGVVIGANAALSANFWNGDIAEILLYNSALSAPNKTLVRDYLTAKYAL